MPKPLYTILKNTNIWFSLLNENCNAYPSHPEPSHTEHIDSIDIIANFSKDSLPRWVTLITILIENWTSKTEKTTITLFK